jgi:ribonuclease G
MAKNLLVINVDIREIRVALIENGIVAELHIERQSAKGTLGNVYVGKVSRVLPGMQAAFIDIGEERAAFLHVEDLIRPDDFEAYLAGKHSHGTTDDAPPPAEDVRDSDPPRLEATPSEAGSVDAAPADDWSSEDSDSGEVDSGEVDSDEVDSDEVDSDEVDAEAVAVAVDGSDAIEDAIDADGSDDGEAPDAGAAEDDDEPEGAEDALQASEPADADDPDDGDDADADTGEADDDAEEDDSPELDVADAASDEPAARAVASDAEGEAEVEGEDADGAEREGDELGAYVPGSDLPGVTVEGEADGDPGKASAKSRTRRGGRGRRRRGRTADVAARVAAPVAAAPPAPRPAARQNDRRGRSADRSREGGRDGGRDGRDRRSGGSRKDPLRVSKSTPIREVVREGQEVIVQVSKEPIGTKGARVTSHISLPGRYVVYLPTVEHVGISKRIGSDKERGRLREAIEAMKPPQGGLIVRTLAEGLTKKSLKNDVGYLVRLWGEIARKRETSRAPDCLYQELDLILKTARDLFTDDIEKIVIDSKEEHARLKRFVEMFMPERAAAIELYEGSEPIFDEYGIEDEIARALSRKVPLASGGHLIIDQAEALTAIDVNTGRFVGKGSKDLEDTILQTNLEAVEEIAYQLRFRNIGGLIILDLIDMDRPSNREKVRRRLETLLAKDKAKTTLNRISDLGLIEMTRKRTRESLGRVMNEPCFYCDGTGNLQSRQTIAYEILRQIKRERLTLRGYSVVVSAHPAVIELLRTEERTAVQEAERRYMRRIELMPRKEYHLEQFDLVGK